MISRAQEGFEYEAIAARNAAQSGDIQSMGRQLAAAHALAVWADTTLLDRYQALKTECWQEYEQWKTTNGAAE
mgnify:FL=1